MLTNCNARVRDAAPVCQLNPQSDERDPDTVTGYEAGEVISFDELPPMVRVHCRDRRLVALRKVQDKTELATANRDEDEAELDLQRGENSLSLSLSPVSYTHLTLPTRRTV